MVEHEILLDKLNHYGIRGLAYNWMKSYLSEREQYVHINGHNSTTAKLSYGVPQGSVLGPLLFIVYINDMPTINPLAKFILYADDANIIMTGNTIQEIQIKYDALIKNLIEWVHINGLSLNVKKTKYMIFSKSSLQHAHFKPTIHNKPIEYTRSTRFLGVILDDKLNWNAHIKATKAKMTRYLGILHKLRSVLPPQAKKSIYHSMIESHLNFCSLVWGTTHKTKIDTLFRAQKKAISSNNAWICSISL